jgi:hypothetical protein
VATCRATPQGAVTAGQVVIAAEISAGVQLPEMLEIARKVVDEHDDEGLSAMLIGTGLTGVDAS